MWWSLAMQPFRFQVQQRKGNDNANAGTLSRQTEPDGPSKAITEGQTAHNATEGQTLHGPHQYGLNYYNVYCLLYT